MVEENLKYPKDAVIIIIVKNFPEIQSIEVSSKIMRLKQLNF